MAVAFFIPDPATVLRKAQRQEQQILRLRESQWRFLTSVVLEALKHCVEDGQNFLLRRSLNGSGNDSSVHGQHSPGDLSSTELGTSICLCIFLIGALFVVATGILLVDAGLVLIGVATIGVVCATVLILEFFYIRIFPDTNRLDLINILLCGLGIPICAYIASVMYCFFMGVWEDDEDYPRTRW